MLVSVKTDFEMAKLLGAIYMKFEPSISFNDFLEHYMYAWWIFRESTVVDTDFESVFDIKFTTVQAVDNIVKKTNEMLIIYSLSDAIDKLDPKKTMFIKSVLDKFESCDSKLTVYGVSSGRMIDMAHCIGNDHFKWDPLAKTAVVC